MTPEGHDRQARLAASLRQLDALGEALSSDARALTDWLAGQDELLDTDDEAATTLLVALERRIRFALRVRHAAQDLSRVAESSTIDEALHHLPATADAHLAPAMRPLAVDTAYFEQQFFDEHVTARSVVGGAPDGLADLWQAVRDLLERADYEVVVEGVERPGSVLKDWALRRRSKRAAKELALAGVIALNEKHVRVPAAAATHDLAAGVAAVLAAMGEREGAHHFDNLLVGQFRDPDGVLVAFSRELSTQERTALLSQPTLLARPSEVLARLAEIVPPVATLPTRPQPRRITPGN